MLSLERKASGASRATHGAWHGIRSIPAGVAALPMSTPDELWELSASHWDRVRAGFARDFRMYDALLHRLHYLRDKPLTMKKRRILLRFLTIGYVISDDVRYFNEYLWFTTERSDEWEHVNVYHFDRNTKGRYHRFPLAGREEVTRAINNYAHFCGEPCTQPRPIKIAAMGVPFLFGRFRREIARQGYPVELVFFPDMFRHGRLWAFLCDSYGILCGCRPRIVHVSGGTKSPHVGESIRNRQIAVAVHRLPFIIPSNIYAQVDYGLLNDHWGPLPFVRGRSTPEYSLLFGFPLVSTVHLIDSGVDTGPIVKYFRITLNPRWTIRRLKRHLSSTKQDRYADAVRFLADGFSMGLIPSYVNNDYDKGLQYYSMHPSLRKYVEKNMFTTVGAPSETLPDAL